MPPRSVRSLDQMFDCVVMLTWSDWKSEPRSNRYHYATRLAKKWPVLFVQPDANGEAAVIENSGSEGVRLMHVSPRYGSQQTESITSTLNDLGYRRPLLWIYNPYFHEFVAACYSPLKVYHATEAYFIEGSTYNPKTAVKLRAVLKHIDLLVTVSPSVLEHYLELGGYSGDSLVLPNGCDYAFWSTAGGSSATTAGGTHASKVAFYQGGLNYRLDWDLLERVITELPDWEFWFCGQLDPRAADRWKGLLRLPNLRNFGEIPVEAVRDLARRASVGIIPFVDAAVAHVSMPLKAFEYVACGLPVVSTPIRALEQHADLFRLVRGADEFRRALQETAAVARDDTLLAKRKRVARGYDYDLRLEEFFGWTGRFLGSNRPQAGKYNLLVLYDAHSVHVKTIDEQPAKLLALFTPRCTLRSGNPREDGSGRSVLV